MHNQEVAANPQPVTKLKALYSFISSRVNALATGLENENSEARASLAVLRRSGTTELGDQPQVWAEVFHNFPDQLVGTWDEPNAYESAAYTALSLFAVHQQSRQERMHKPGQGLGTAVKALANPNDSDDVHKGAFRRFNSVVTAQTNDQLIHHLRGLVQQFRAEKIPLDYGRLATDLVGLSFPDSARAVRLRWARELNTVVRKSPSDNSETPQASSSAE